MTFTQQRAASKTRRVAPHLQAKSSVLERQSLRFEGLQEKISADALRSFEVNDTLEPKVWEDDKLKPEVREALLKIVNDFLIDLPFD
jgi:hypothetical protein